MHGRRKSLLTALITTLVLAVPVVYGIQNQQKIIDWWRLRDYQPPASISQLAQDTTMNDFGRRVFYVERPAILDKETFYTSCNENEQTVVLGCFVDGKGIFVLQVDDKRLDGIEQVTAAHEMLHAAYERLDTTERERIVGLLNQTYANLNDEDLTKKIDLYKKNNADIPNELHSILGTEIEKLPAELEAYYRRYFDERGKIVRYAQAYRAVFKSRQEKLDTYDKTLAELESQIQANNDRLDVQSKEIQAEESRLQELRSRNEIDAYNAGVAPFNAKVASYNALIGKTKQLIATYKNTLTSRNQVAEEAQELSKALDSRISTRENR